MSREQRFTDIFLTNEFKGNESRSGMGAESSQTRIIIEKLPGLFQEFGITSIIDVPCGDCNWIKNLFPYFKENNIQYQGRDIVEPLIKQNIKDFNLPFTKTDLVTDLIPPVDLLLCRDCLVHLSFESAKQVLYNFMTSNVRYLLTTTFTNRNDNISFPDGTNWYPIALTKDPFNLPEPLLVINEGCTECNNEYTDKSLALWSRESLIGKV